ncbi:MAG: glycerophosphodiester phosphodiesterase family protein [Gemmatimonadaceae bacterium]
MNVLLSVGSHRRLVVAHRGNSARAPENTMEAFQQSASLGVDGMEFDVRLTRDGRAIAMHDATVDRTTNGSGAVAALTLAQIRAFDAGARFTRDGGHTRPYAGRGIVAPTLEEVLDAFPSVPCIIEIKSLDVSAEVRRIVLDQRATDRCVVGSFVEHALDPFAGSGIPVGATTSQMRALLWQGYLRQPVRRVPFQLVSTPATYRHIPLPIGGWVRILEPLGIPVHVWTVDDTDVARRLWAKGARAILSNDPATMLQVARS